MIGAKHRRDIDAQVSPADITTVPTTALTSARRTAGFL
jgi:hypothetical protein